MVCFTGDKWSGREAVRYELQYIIRPAYFGSSMTRQLILMAFAFLLASRVDFCSQRAVPTLIVGGESTFVRNGGNVALVSGDMFVSSTSHLDLWGIELSQYLPPIMANSARSLAPRTDKVFIAIDPTASKYDIEQLRQVMNGKTHVGFMTWFGLRYTETIHRVQYIETR